MGYNDEEYYEEDYEPQSPGFGSKPRSPRYGSKLHRTTVVIATLTVLACFAILTMSALIPPPPPPPPPPPQTTTAAPMPGDLTQIKLSATDYADEDLCKDWRDKSVNDTLWNDVMERTSKLNDNKFTVAIQTYQRPHELNKTIHKLTNYTIPSLHEIVVVWNDLETETPEDFIANNSVPVRYRKSKRNSLNSKLWADPEFKTTAILLHDDDVYYEPEDLEFVYQTWRHKGKDRLTGAFARCSHWREPDGWTYDMCNSDKSGYAMILTGLAFVHMAFLEYWSSEDPYMVKMRNYVDDKFNCEDIGLNFVASWLTCRPPLQVSGPRKPVNTTPHVGLSTKNHNHMKVRAQCVRDFVDELHGYMPLRNSTEYIRRGLITG